MTVKELITELQKYNEDLLVGLWETEMDGCGTWTGIDVSTDLNEPEVHFVKADTFAVLTDMENKDHICILCKVCYTLYS